MKNSRGIIIGVVFVSGIFLALSLFFGSILYILGVESTSIGLFVLFTLCFFSLSSLVDLFFESLMKVLTNLLNLTSKQGFSLYLLCDLVISYQLLRLTDRLFSGVAVPKITAIVFVMLLAIVTCLVEKPLNKWSEREE